MLVTAIIFSWFRGLSATSEGELFFSPAFGDEVSDSAGSSEHLSTLFAFELGFFYIRSSAMLDVDMGLVFFEK